MQIIERNKFNSVVKKVTRGFFMLGLLSIETLAFVAVVEAKSFASMQNEKQKDREVTKLSVFEVQEDKSMAYRIYRDYRSMREEIISGEASSNTIAFIKKYHLKRLEDDERFIVNRVIIPGVNRNLELSYKNQVIFLKESGDTLLVDLKEVENQRVLVNGNLVQLDLRPEMSLRVAYQANKDRIKTAILKSKLAQMSWLQIFTKVALSPFALMTACSNSQGGDAPGFASAAISNMMKPLEMTAGFAGAGVECVGECLRRGVNSLRPYTPPAH